MQTVLNISPRLKLPKSVGVSSAPADKSEIVEGRLRIVQPKTKRPRLSAGEIMRRLAFLSVADVMDVNRATIREGESHCIWPPEVLETFRSAQVITEGSAPHYILREGNLKRIK